MGWRIEKLGPDLGAAVRGLDAAAPLDEGEFADLRGIWLSHGGLLVLRDQRLTPDSQVAFARRFGAHLLLLAEAVKADTAAFMIVADAPMDPRHEQRNSADARSQVSPRSDLYQASS